jgi:hypothetical protein
MLIFTTNMTKLSTRLFVEFERRGLRVYNTVLEWTIPEKRNGSHGTQDAAGGKPRIWPASVSPISPVTSLSVGLYNSLWSYAVWGK